MFTLIVCEYLRTFPNFESLCDLQSRENILLLNCIFLPKDLITFRTCKIRQERFLFFLNKIFLQTFLIAFFATLGSIFSLLGIKVSIVLAVSNVLEKQIFS